MATTRVGVASDGRGEADPAGAAEPGPLERSQEAVVRWFAEMSDQERDLYLDRIGLLTLPPMATGTGAAAAGAGLAGRLGWWGRLKAALGMGAPAGKTVHPPPPAWYLEESEAATRALLERGVVDAADPRAVEALRREVGAFHEETWQHVHDVDALVRELGGFSRAVPPGAASAAELRGVHDLTEHVSARRLKSWVEDLERRPLHTRDGREVPVPDWLKELAARTPEGQVVDVGKLSPEVSWGLSRSRARGAGGVADPDALYAVRLHNFAAHHAPLLPARSGRTPQALTEAVADVIVAMRQPRSYRPRPMSYPQIEAELVKKIDAGELPEAARALYPRALEVEQRLERAGGVNPYYLLE